MMALQSDRRIAELLADPMVQLIMRADRVDQRNLATQLRRLASRLEAAKRHAALAPRPHAPRGAAEPVEPPFASYAAAGTKLLSFCGARCS